MLGGGRGRRLRRKRGLVGGHELDRAGQAGEGNSTLTGATEIPTRLAVAVPVFVDIAELEPGHQTPSQLLGVGSSLESASKARSRERMSQILRASILIAAGILPSATISSNLPAETPIYI